MMDFATLPLGRLPYAPKAKDLLLSKYVADAGRLIEAAQVPAAPCMLEMRTPGGAKPAPDADPLGNVAKGDCVFAAAGHMQNLVAKLVGRPELVVTAEMVLSEYDRRTGGLDVGYVVRAMLDIWQREGLWGTRLAAYALVGDDPAEQAIAAYLGCGIIGGYSLPVYSQSSTNGQGQQLWDIPTSGLPAGDYPGKWGGHAIFEHSASPALFVGNSWGEEDTAWTRAWDAACGDERWFCLLDIWQEANGRAPNGFAWEDLLADVRARTA
jgi:hypothetical protein